MLLTSSILTAIGVFAGLFILVIGSVLYFVPEALAEDGDDLEEDS